ncbi:MAG: DUF1684 domain-containing protein [Cyclobacteriaceae bacterium]
MKKLFYIVIAGIAGIIGYSIFSGNSNKEYIESAQAVRTEKIKFLKTSSQSPFQLHDVPFETPEYFPIDSKYRVRATLERINTPQRVIIENSDGSSEIYIRFAFANFKIDGQPFQLLILKPAGFGALNQYFTAFADKTSGITTYGGGRYLDLEIGKSDHIEIDFNQAYNPYCAYAPDYSCPLPPSENILPIAIEAGEKDYKH